MLSGSSSLVEVSSALVEPEVRGFAAVGFRVSVQTGCVGGSPLTPSISFFHQKHVLVLSPHRKTVICLSGPQRATERLTV